MTYNGRMTATVELVTPAQAKIWLDTMPRQRTLRQSRVSRYCQSRRAGRWVTTHQGIAIDEDGLLRDGQHRCKMVLDTGLPTYFLVTRNVPREAFLHIDTQLSRTIVDAMRIAGQGDVNHSTVALAQILPMLPGNGSRKKVWWDIDCTQWILEEDAAAITFAEERAGKTITRGVRALLARAWHYEDRDKLDQFTSVLHDEGKAVDLGEAGKSALRYRTFLKDCTGQVGWEAEIEKYKKGQTALLAFLQGRGLQKIYAMEGDQWPWPLREQFDRIVGKEVA